MEAYDMLEDAVYYAAQRATELGQDGTERIAVVFKDQDGKYHFTDPQGNGKNSSAKARITFPKSAVLVALVHNHPADKRLGWNAGQDRFSPEDAKMAKGLGVPSYMTFGDDMQVRSLAPGARRLEGQHFDHIPEVKPAGQYLARAVNALLEDAK